MRRSSPLEGPQTCADSGAAGLNVRADELLSRIGVVYDSPLHQNGSDSAATGACSPNQPEQALIDNHELLARIGAAIYETATQGNAAEYQRIAARCAATEFRERIDDLKRRLAQTKAHRLAIAS